MTECIGIILAVIGILMAVGAVIYGMWTIDPVLGFIFGGLFLYIVGMVMTNK